MAWAFLWFSSFKSRWEGFTILFKTHGISIIKFFSTLIIKLFHCESITLILFCCQKRHKYFKSRHVHHHLNLKWVNSKMLSPLSADFTKWSNTHKQFVVKLPTKSLSVFDQFVGLVLKRVNNKHFPPTLLKVWFFKKEKYFQ